jgi:CRP-like cAMP-binding protein
VDLNLLDLFAEETDLAFFAAGQVIFDENDTGDVMYIVKEGQVDIKARDMTVEIVGAGGIFGEMGLVDTSARSASAIARTDCRLIAIDENRFVSTVRQNPYLALHVMSVLVRRLRNMNQLL